ncbi:MAG TPA: hypothetical protein VMK12_32105 [Anaeromyxobacteraceae bacterium]|nr:hypothetical protein [Anaeromyxobacteraceae bacterium]
MATMNLDVAIRELVVAEIERALDPYRDMFGRLGRFLGTQKAAAALEPRSLRRPGRRGGRRSAGLANGKGEVSAFTLGQKVRYRQGRGAFEALVTKIDPAGNALTLQRISDSKIVVRPPSKVMA